MDPVRRSFIPAAGHDWLLPLYDPLQRLLGVEGLQRALIEPAALRHGQRALDIGCGTGSLTLLLARLHPDSEVVGLDPDRKALERARRKAARASLRIEFEQGFSDQLPYPDACFDRVFSSFMFHHLAAGDQEKTLNELRRVLRPSGSLHLMDFDWKRQGKRGRLARLLHGDDRLPHPDYSLADAMRAAGFAEVGRSGERRTILGNVAQYQASVAPGERQASAPG